MNQSGDSEIIHPDSLLIINYGSLHTGMSLQTQRNLKNGDASFGAKNGTDITVVNNLAFWEISNAQNASFIRAFTFCCSRSEN